MPNYGITSARIDSLGQENTKIISIKISFFVLGHKIFTELWACINSPESPD
jgi:hypothetical protein